MKNILSIAFILVAFAANGQIQEYVIEASDSLITRGVLQIDADKFKATTQVSSDDTTLVSLDYLTGLLDASEYADSLAFHSGTGYLVYYRQGVALDSTSLDGRYQTTLTNPVTGTGTTNYLPKWTGLTTQENSQIYDNGTNIGIGTTTSLDGEKVNINGRLRVGSFQTFGGGKSISIAEPSATEASLHIWQAGTGDALMGFPANISTFFITNRYNTNTLGDPLYSISLTASGNFGVGNTNPQQKLDVNGNIRVRGVGTNTTSTLLGLDSNGDLTTNVSITGGATWKGGWNASTNTPTLSDATGTNGWWYKVTVAGTQNLGSGSITFAVGDDVIHNGTIWQKFSAMISEADPVFVASDVYNWTTQDSIDWTNAYSWGNHANAGYLTSETDGSVSNELQNLSLGLTTTTTQPIGISSGLGITLPAATTSLAGLMTSTDKTNLNTVVGWGNHAGLYLPIGGTAVAANSLPINNTTVDGSLTYMQISEQNATGDNPTGGWSSIIKMGHGNPDTYYARYLGFDFFTENIYTRKRTGGTAGTWYKIFSEYNFTDNSSSWNTAYNDKVNSAAFTGTTTKTLTLTQQDGGTVTANFTDLVNDADASATNEGSLTVTAGTATTSVINSNTSGSTPVTVAVDGTNLGISESGNTITLSNLKPDQTVSLTQGGATTITGTYPNFTISSTDNNTTYTGGNGLVLNGNAFDLGLQELTTGTPSLNTHWIPWVNSANNLHYRVGLVDLQGIAGYNAGKIQNVTVASTAPTTDYVMKYNGSTWSPAPDATGSSLTSGDAITVVGDSINYKPTRITATMTDLNIKNNQASIYTNFEYNGAIYRTTLGQMADLSLYNAREVQSYYFSPNTPDVGDVWKWDGTQYAPAPDETGGMTDPMTTRGDIIYRNSSNATARLGRGTAGQLLYSNGTDLSWRTPVKSDIGLGNVENTALSTWTGSTNIGTVGSITQGNWNADPIGVTKGGTGKTSYTAYALLAGGTTSTGTLQQVSGVGTAGQVLTSNGAGALPTWQAAPSGGGMTDPMTTAGDMIFRNGSNVTARLPKGAEGQILSISSGLPSWINNSSGGWVDNGANITLATSTDNVLIGTTIDSGFKLRVEGNSYHTGSVQVNGSLIALKELRLSEYDVVGLGLNFDRPALFISPTDKGIKVKTTASGREIYNITPSVRANALNASSMRYYDGNHITDTLTVNTIYYITHIPQGGEGEILVKQDGTGGRTLTLYFYPYGQTGEPDSSTELIKVTVGATTAIKATANKHTLIRYRRWGTKVTLEYLQEP